MACALPSREPQSDIGDKTRSVGVTREVKDAPGQIKTVLLQKNMPFLNIQWLGEKNKKNNLISVLKFCLLI